MSLPEVTIQQAYEEACLALGDATVQQRLIAKGLGAELERVNAELAELREASDATGGVEPE